MQPRVVRFARSSIEHTVVVHPIARHTGSGHHDGHCAEPDPTEQRAARQRHVLLVRYAIRIADASVVLAGHRHTGHVHATVKRCPTHEMFDRDDESERNSAPAVVSDALPITALPIWPAPKTTWSPGSGAGVGVFSVTAFSFDRGGTEPVRND